MRGQAAHAPAQAPQASYSRDQVDWDLLGETVRHAVHFLDNIVDVNTYTLDAIRDMTLANRKIGLGVMGWHEMLIQLGIPYDSDAAVEMAGHVTGFINEVAVAESSAIAERRGSFANFDQSIWPGRGLPQMRNAAVTTVAPTGTVSIVADTSSGIEPLFALCFVRNVLSGSRLFEENRFFRRMARERGFYSRELMAHVARHRGVRGIESVPEDVRRLFGTALEIAPEWHVRMQAAFQQHTHSGVSKTVNLPHDATQEDVAAIYRLAHQLKCKGVTVFRYGCKQEQVLESHPEALGGLPGFGSEYDGRCRLCDP